MTYATLWLRSSLPASLMCAAIVGVATCSAAPAQTSDVAAGKQLYEGDCSGCHKPDGSGGVNLGAVASSDLRSAALESAYHGNVSAIRASILNGTGADGKPLNPIMPLFQASLTSQQADSIIAYLKTLHP